MPFIGCVLGGRVFGGGELQVLKMTRGAYVHLKEIRGLLRHHDMSLCQTIRKENHRIQLPVYSHKVSY